MRKWKQENRMRKICCDFMRDITKTRARSNKWKRSENGKRWLHEYRQRREVKERQMLYLRVWRQNPLVKEKEREYYGKIKEQLEARKQTKEWREKRKVWLNSPKGKAINAMNSALRRCVNKNGDLTAEQWMEVKYISPICNACGRFVECENLTLDHIIPISKNGQHTISNVQALCLSCNVRKKDKLPEFYSPLRS